jgi:4'-phosphopantetheinyl transferase EntD
MPTWNGGVMLLHVIKFDRDSFTMQAYDSYQIACPPAITRSVMKRQAEFFFGRLAARYALDPFGLGQLEVPSGKFREPLWPPGIIGSISHNQRFAVAVVVDQSKNAGLGVGIDIESIVTPEMEEVLLDTVVSSGELDYLRSLTALLPLNVLLSLVFSAKESFFKASFNTVGRYFDFDAIELSHIDTKRQSIWFFIRKPLSCQLTVGALRQVYYMMIDDVTICTGCNLPNLPTV